MTPNEHDNPNTNAEPNPELDQLLRQWHDQTAEAAARSRAGVMEAIADDAPPVASTIEAKGAGATTGTILRRIFMNRYSPAAAALFVLAALAPFLVPSLTQESRAQAENVVYAPEGGLLDAIGADGARLGPCELEHTDVDAEISGRFARVNIKQRYHNPHDEKIEAVYTFPMSHGSAVDRMTMTVGDRVVVGEVKEKLRARQIYEGARAQGRVASLLEQERPNIFTQSVANIEPGATIDIQISYVELLTEHDGKFEFHFPTTVAPRYIPGMPSMPSPGFPRPRPMPDGLASGRGLIMLAPGTIADLSTPEGVELTTDRVRTLLTSATPVRVEDAEKLPEMETACTFRVDYPDGSGEMGFITRKGIGELNGRPFICPPPIKLPDPGEPFAEPTPQVPDADRITPMPVKPGERAGHDISISVTIDTGGPGLVDIESGLHEIDTRTLAGNANEPRRVRLSLADRDAIPNRDFVLSWATTGDGIGESFFTHTGDLGNYFALVLEPPKDMDAAALVPVEREIVFIMDVSGSMKGLPIEKSKDVLGEIIKTMRPSDRFNVVTFSNTNESLFNDLQPVNDESVAKAIEYVESRVGGGGTEMLPAINTALTGFGAEAGREPRLVAARELFNLPADGRPVALDIKASTLTKGQSDNPALRVYTASVGDGLELRFVGKSDLPQSDQGDGTLLRLRGTWTAEGDQRLFRIESARFVKPGSPIVKDSPLRLVVFLSDGEVGNDFAVLDAIKNRPAGTRVFSFSIGNSANRFLMDNMARIGGGVADFIIQSAEADEAVKRFTDRVDTPVLTNISIAFDGVEVSDVIPDPSGFVPDLWDEEPIVILGRYDEPGAGTLRLRGTTGEGVYERDFELTLPEANPEHDVVPTLWARKHVRNLMDQDLPGVQTGSIDPGIRETIVGVGERFGLLTQYTSFVAVDKLKVTIDGEPRLVRIPIELPNDADWTGFFGEQPQIFERPEPVEQIRRIREEVTRAAEDIQLRYSVSETLTETERQVVDLVKAVTLTVDADTPEATRAVVDELLVVQPDNEVGLLMRDALDLTVATERLAALHADRMLEPVESEGIAAPGAERDAGRPMAGLAVQPSATPPPPPTAAAAPNAQPSTLSPGSRAPAARLSLGLASRHDRFYALGTPALGKKNAQFGRPVQAPSRARRGLSVAPDASRAAPVDSGIVAGGEFLVLGDSLGRMPDSQSRLIGAGEAENIFHWFNPLENHESGADAPDEIDAADDGETEEAAPGPVERFTILRQHPEWEPVAHLGALALDARLADETSEARKIHDELTGLVPGGQVGYIREPLIAVLAACEALGADEREQGADIGALLIRRYPTWAPARALSRILEAEEVDLAKVEQLVTDVRAKLDARLRDARIRARMTPDVRRYLATPRGDGKPLTLSVLVEDAGSETVTALEAVGLDLITANEGAKTVVGRLDAEALAELALTEGVRLIDLIAQ